MDGGGNFTESRWCTNVRIHTCCIRNEETRTGWEVQWEKEVDKVLRVAEVIGEGSSDLSKVEVNPDAKEVEERTTAADNGSGCPWGFVHLQREVEDAQLLGMFLS